MKLVHRVWERARGILPRESFFFDRPMVMLQSDDWGRVGLRDHEGLAELQAAGMELGQRPYDFYTLETADDVAALHSVLTQHRDSAGRSPVVVMNFITANLQFPENLEDSAKLTFLPLADGLPRGWSRAGLFETYRAGKAAGVFHPALHGISHFCRSAVERHARDSGPRGELLRRLWRAGTPYIYWRMPWIGYEYWDLERPSNERFLSKGAQAESIGQAIGLFARMFTVVPGSACAPGYRANDDTHRAWSQYGLRCAQNGPCALTAPHFDRHGLLQIYRTVEIEPAIDQRLSLDACLRRAEQCFAAGVPATVSMHSINFHSTVCDFRSLTLQFLDEFLTALEARHADLLYVHDDDLYRLVQTGCYESGTARIRVTVKKHMRRPAVQRSAQE